MSTPLSIGVTAQGQTTTQNVKFPLYVHNKLWDSSLNSTFAKVTNLAVQIFKEAFKYIANAGLHVANGIYSLVHKHPVTVNPSVAKMAEKACEDCDKAEDFSIQTTIEADILDDVNLDEGVPAEETKDTWLNAAFKATAILTTVGLVGAASVFTAKHFGYCSAGITNACGMFAQNATKTL